MSRKGPLLTLLGGGALAIVLLAASVNAASRDDEPPPAAAGDEQGETPAPTAAPTETPAAAPDTYVGYVDGGGASVAIIIDDNDEATAYVCDGDTVEVWLTGEASNDELLLSGKEGTLTGAYDGERATGETQLQGTRWTFTADSVAPPEGLYQFAGTVAGGAEVEGNWIVLPDGTQIGILTVDGVATSAPALDLETGEVTVDGETLTAQRRDGA